MSVLSQPKLRFKEFSIPWKIDSIGNIKASKVVSNEKDAKNKKLFSLKNPKFMIQLDLTLGIEGKRVKKTWQMAVSKRVDLGQYAYVSNREAVFKLETDRVTKIDKKAVDFKKSESK